ncbi:unnamed protein product [Lasius platythorax]|uniref:TNF family profile domain-containing protein n=1 Tax=Lasius platythorax TaxID=488582 RepID=A0AAV2NFW9_9HYME
MLHEKIKDLEVRVNNLVLKFRYCNRLINIRQIYWIEDSESFICKSANLSETENDDDSNTTSTILNLDDSTIPSASAQSLAGQNYVLKRNISKISDIIFPIMSPISLIKNNLIEPEIKDLSRQKRAILKIETQNHTTTKDEKAGNDTVDIQRESRARKLWRDEGRRGPAVVTFVGAIPEQEINTVYIGPWIKSNRNNSLYDLSKFHMVEENYAIEIAISGLYMISVQIFYFGKSINHSYWVLLKSEGSSTEQKLITCAIASVSAASEVSCYTSVTTYLQPGDRLSIQQQERNRLVNMREGYSQIQLVLLANDRHRRGLT